jgi:copper chaperone CopZ
VHEALVGLPGVQSVEVDAKEDLCHVAFDPERVTPEKMLDAIKGTGFEGVIRPAKSGEGQ